MRSSNKPNFINSHSNTQISINLKLQKKTVSSFFLLCTLTKNLSPNYQSFIQSLKNIINIELEKKT